MKVTYKSSDPHEPLLCSDLRKFQSFSPGRHAFVHYVSIFRVINSHEIKLYWSLKILYLAFWICTDGIWNDHFDQSILCWVSRIWSKLAIYEYWPNWVFFCLQRLGCSKHHIFYQWILQMISKYFQHNNTTSYLWNNKCCIWIALLATQRCRDIRNVQSLIYNQ